ncbi:MAG: CcmD family protein [Cytophagales bacterium]|nr:MAG: CcmD family protein [Cytophagales bacterium]
MKNKTLKVSILFFVCSIYNVFSQSVEMADAFRQDGKIYVVLAVITVMLTSIFFVLIRLDRKISKF